MAKEKFSVGPVKAEGPRSTIFLQILVAGGLGLAFYLGKLSTLIDACFGFKLQ